MIRPEDDELIHRALDGALSPGEAEQFRARVAAEPELGARAEHLERLAAEVDGLGPEEPPIGFSDRVMAEVAAVSPPRPAWHRRLASLPAAIGRQLFPWFAHRSQQGSHSSDSFRKAGMAGGGVIVAKKALWGVAGLAVVVILAVVYFNGRTVDQGAQGAIGAADRYRGAQPSSVDAKPGNAQAFLQSDTFDKIVKNKDIRSLLGDPEICALLASDEFAALAKNQGAMAALAGRGGRRGARRDGSVRFLKDENAVAALVADEQAALFAKLAGEEQAALFRKLADAEQAALFRSWRTPSRRELFTKLADDEQAALFRRLAGAEQAALFRKLADAEQAALFRSWRATSRRTVPKLAGDDQAELFRSWRRRAGGAQGASCRRSTSRQRRFASWPARSRRRCSEAGGLGAGGAVPASWRTPTRPSCSSKLAGDDQAALFQELAGEDQTALFRGWRTASRPSLFQKLAGADQADAVPKLAGDGPGGARWRNWRALRAGGAGDAGCRADSRRRCSPGCRATVRRRSRPARRLSRRSDQQVVRAPGCRAGVRGGTEERQVQVDADRRYVPGGAQGQEPGQGDREPRLRGGAEGPGPRWRRR